MLCTSKSGDERGKTTTSEDVSRLAGGWREKNGKTCSIKRV